MIKQALGDIAAAAVATLVGMFIISGFEAVSDFTGAVAEMQNKSK